MPVARRTKVGKKKIKRKVKASKKVVAKKKPVKKKIGGAYFAESGLSFISSGCELLDLALGGGWPIGRISNVVGDKSTGKTLLAIEAIANGYSTYGDGIQAYYLEAEAAFNKAYANTLGMPVDKVEFIENVATVEGFYKSLLEVVEKHKDNGVKALYILDSLDALSDDAEMGREIDKASFGAEKAKKMSELFRKITRKVEQSNVHLMIISQIRDKLNVTFGRKTTRSGGKALDFYASQVLFLAEKNKIYRTFKGVKRPIGIDVVAKVDKNKVGMPYRQVDLSVIFSYGIDELAANLNFLVSVNKGIIVDPVLKTKGAITTFIKGTDKLKDSEYKKLCRKVKRITRQVWVEIEDGFLPYRKKY